MGSYETTISAKMSITDVSVLAKIITEIRIGSYLTVVLLDTCFVVTLPYLCIPLFQANARIDI